MRKLFLVLLVLAGIVAPTGIVAQADPSPYCRPVTPDAPHGKNFRTETTSNVLTRIRYYDGNGSVSVHCNGPVTSITIYGLYYYNNGNNVVSSRDFTCHNAGHCDGRAFAAARYFSPYINCDKRAVADYVRLTGSYVYRGETTPLGSSEGPLVTTRRQPGDPSCAPT
jgi:hypothetical protein